MFATLLHDFGYHVPVPTTSPQCPPEDVEGYHRCGRGALGRAAFNENHGAESEDGAASRQVLELIFGRDGPARFYGATGGPLPSAASFGATRQKAACCRRPVPAGAGSAAYRLAIHPWHRIAGTADHHPAE